MGTKTTPRAARIRRHDRVRRKVNGTSERPRLCVFRSLHHTYAQVIDDDSRCTMAASSTLDPEVKAAAVGKAKTDAASLVGTSVAKKALAKGISQVALDRGGYKYHGRVKALAEAAREVGLVF